MLRAAKASFRYVPEVQAVRTREELLAVFRELIAARPPRRVDHQKDLACAIESFMRRYNLTFDPPLPAATPK